MVPTAVYESHFRARRQSATAPNDSLEWCAVTSTATSTLPAGCLGNFDVNDRLWPYHAIESKDSFGLFADKAHIFPHKNCVKSAKTGDTQARVKVTTDYEWLDNPANAEFNFLYMSKDVHTMYDGTGHGRGTKNATGPLICVEPEPRTTDVNRFKIDRDSHTNELRAKIPLRVWCLSDEVAKVLGRKLRAGAELFFDESARLPYFSNIFVECVHRNIPMDPDQDLLLDGDSGERVVVYRKKVPFMDERLSTAWSLNAKTGELSSTEIMEKCLLWGANETWNVSWQNVVNRRDFESRVREAQATAAMCMSSNGS